MNPYDHARSSARIHGGRWEDYHPLHAWFDATKAVRCHFTHRALRHHDEGVLVAGRRFGDAVVNSDGAAVPIAELGRQHMLEDCRFAPTASDWTVGYEVPDWVAGDEIGAEALAELSARRFGGTPEDHLPLHRWFLETRSWTTGAAHLMVRHHAFGCFEAEETFGPVITWASGGVPTRVAAEHHVQTVVGRVPTAADWLKRIRGDRWMLQATSAQKLGLDRAA